MDPQYRKKLKSLAHLMKSKTGMPVPVVKELLDLMNLTAAPEDVEFLLKFGAEPRTAEQTLAATGKPEDKAGLYIDSLVRKGWLWPYVFETGEKDMNCSPSWSGGWNCSCATAGRRP